MAILVYTTFIENKGVDEGTNHWSFKDSQTFRVLGTDDRPASAVALVIQYTNSEFAMHYGLQYPTDWEQVSDDFLVEEDERFLEADVTPPITLRYERKQAVCLRCKKRIKGLIDWLRMTTPIPVHPDNGCEEEITVTGCKPICSDCVKVITGYVKMIMTDPPIPVCISCTPDRTFSKPKPKARRIN